jgi:hypothetical protein
MKTEHKKYIQENAGKKSVEEIAKDLNLKTRKVKKIIERFPVKKTQKIKLSLPAIPSIDVCDKNDKLIKTLLISILVLAGIVRLMYLIQLQGNPLPFSVIKWEAFDQYRFMQLVNEFVGGNWLGSQVTRYSPAYSYLIAALYKIFLQSINIVFIFQMLFGVVAVYVFYKAASLLFSNKKVGLIAAFLAAIYSPFIFYEGCTLRASVVAYSNLLIFEKVII